uniref:Integrase catalytic domain-containing protein n=1 Tax=Trichogramma kaykai TaxID=54128 RepID=A0ABD2W2B8_9HYME
MFKLNPHRVVISHPGPRGFGDLFNVISPHKYLLTVIDVFSKYSWAVPVKSENAEYVTNAMSTILNNKISPKNLQTDNGKEFYNSNFQNLIKN